jgi:hypothetical protein
MSNTTKAQQAAQHKADDAADAKADAAQDKADAKAEAAKPTPPPIEFHAQDRYHAVTYVAKALHDLPGEIKDRVTSALQGMMTHRGPVQVNIPATAALPGDPKAAKDAPDDPLRPDDGAFAVKPINFAHV